MFKHALMGFGIAFAALIPPGVHFVSGPLGPLIGGWFAGSKRGATPGEAVWIGLIMGVLLVTVVAAAVVPVQAFTTLLDDLNATMLALGAVVILIYSTVMGCIGATIGGWMVRRSAPERAEPGTSHRVV